MFWLSALLSAAIFLLVPLSATSSAFVYETSAEFLTSGDFNGDGVPDVLVLDKATGNARVGYDDGNHNLVWSAPVPTGVPAPAALAVGHFRDTNQDAIAVTAAELNRVHLLRLSDSSNAPAILTPQGVGPNLLVGLAAPYGTVGDFDSLLVGSGGNSTDPGVTLVELFGFVADATSYYLDRVAQQAYLATANSLSLGGDPVSYAAAIQSDANQTNDTFVVLSPSNHLAALLSLPGLPSGTAYAFGNFNQEQLPRFLFYVPGQSNILVQSLIATNGGYAFDTATTVSLDEPIAGVFFLATDSGVALVQFGDGVQGLTLPGGSPSLSAAYRSGGGGAGNAFTGVVPLGGGNFALLDGPPGNLTAAHAQVVNTDGATFSQVSAANLPTISTRGTRANVWLFQSEPFVSNNPGFVSSLNAPDWTSSAALSGGSLSVLAETDNGPAAGLDNPASDDLGALPAGAAWAIPDQYRDCISLFAYSSPRPAEPVEITIAPDPGLYGGPIFVSFTTVSGSDQVLYRLGSNANYQVYGGSFLLTNDATVQYYGSNLLSGSRSRLYTAAYSFGQAGAQPPVTPVDIAPGTTNPAPVFQTNHVILSDLGTVFYGRRPPLANLAQGFLGPTAYLSFADSPFNHTNAFTYFYLETFEEGALTVPGVAVSPGWQVANPAPSTDSVDADDGSINGSGSAGHSFYTANQHSLTITFDPSALGGHYPTHVGIVWTDVGTVSSGLLGHGNVIVSALDANGLPLGSRVGLNLGDGLVTGQTAEDRFFGVVNRGGISSFTITMTNSLNWEVDHLQYGFQDSPGFDGTLWAINLDGSGETYITTGARPRVSRDGQWLAFLREGNPFNNQGNLWVRNLASGQEGRLFVSNPDPAANTNMLICYDWDLTETNLVFDYNNTFWRLGLDGSLSQFSVAANLNQGAPSINPVDGRVAFQSLYPGPSAIYVAPPDLSSAQLLFSYPTGPRWPAWSPDGEYLTLADGYVSPVIDGGRNLWVAELDSSNTSVFQITGFTDNTNGFLHGAQWAPSGTTLVGAGTVYGTNGIWLIPLNGDCMCSDAPVVRLPTSDGDPIDFVGSILAAPAPLAVVQPSLFIVLQTNAAVVYWSAGYAGFTLETTADLAPPATWTALPAPYDFDGYLNSYTIPVASLLDKQFFRLHFTGTSP